MYEMIATFVGMRFVGVPLATDFGLDLAAMRVAIKQHQPAAVFLAYPNNPTGNLFDEQAIETLLCEAPGLVVVDEAYHAFAQQSFMDRLGQFDNLLVMRTLSKQGLAGLRLVSLAVTRVARRVRQAAPAVQHQQSHPGERRVCAEAQGGLDEQAARLRAERARLLQELLRCRDVQSGERGQISSCSAPPSRRIRCHSTAAAGCAH